jgi:CBS domain-containing protein
LPILREIMKVTEILKRKGSVLVTIKPSDTVDTLSRLLREKRIGAVVVSADGVTIDGFVSERDLAYCLCIYGANLPTMRVAEIMTTRVVTCAPDDDVAKVASAMQAHHIRHIPVVQHNRAHGMVSIRDLLNIRVDQLQTEAAMLRSFVNAALTEPQDR